MFTIKDLTAKLGDATEAFDTRLWVHSHVGDGWYPVWNSWNKVQAFRVKNDIFDGLGDPEELPYAEILNQYDAWE
jgi:hypothetical protein